MELRDKRALVTGGTRGIGAAIALDLALHGADLALCGRHADEEAQQTCAAVEALGRKGALITADMGDPDQVARCVQQSVDVLGGIDIVVHAAGGPSWGRIEEVSPEQWKTTFDVHVHAAYHLCRDVLPHLKKNDESVILLISSVAGLRGCPGAIAYGTAKGAILQFTRMLARDLADDNIRVNCVSPGIIRTRFHKNMTAEQKAHNLANRIPLHREGTSQQVADVVRMLTTNEFITGENVTIDGGTSMQVVR